MTTGSVRRMSPSVHRRRIAAFTLSELVLVLTIVITLACILFVSLARPRVKIARIKCTTNLKNIGLGIRIFRSVNGPNSFPLINTTSQSALDVFSVISNEISTPMILLCPDDAQRRVANPSSFSNLTLSNISYFVSLSATETNALSFLAGDRHWMINGSPVTAGILPLKTNTRASWSREIHNGVGNILMGDGSVQQASSKRLVQMVVDQNEGTNYLAFP